MEGTHLGRTGSYIPKLFVKAQWYNELRQAPNQTKNKGQELPDIVLIYALCIQTPNPTRHDSIPRTKKKEKEIEKKVTIHHSFLEHAKSLILTPIQI
jgi:hypothetical protein